MITRTKPPRGRRTKFGVTNLRGCPAHTQRNDEPSSEDARELERLLQLLRGRGEFDWGKLDARAEGKSRD
jgi:hypothetical protein